MTEEVKIEIEKLKSRKIDFDAGYEKGYDAAIQSILMKIVSFRKKLEINHADHWMTFKSLGELESILVDLLDNRE